jgi:hypothetical protein
VAANTSVARPCDLCLEAALAARITSGVLAEVRGMRTDLRRFRLHELVPDPGEPGVAVDDMPNPFGTPVLADHYLRPPRDVIPLAIPAAGSWEQYAEYVTARAFRAASQIGAEEMPGLAVVGNGDGLSHRERAEIINSCLLRRQPFAAVNPIDRVARFLSIDSEDRYASVAIVARGLQHVAIAVAAGSTIAVGTHHTALVQRDGSGLIPVGDLPGLPVLPASIAAPAGTPGRNGLLTGTLIPEWGNAIMVSGMVLGGLEAAYQPDCRPCDGAAIYIAAAAGRSAVRVGNGRLLTHPYQVQALVINALRKGDRLPACIAARDELAAHRLLRELRRRGIA